VREFRYERAEDVAGAVATLAAAPEGAFLAGGTNLVDLMKLGVATPDVLVDVRELTSTEVEERPDGGLRIGAAVPNADLGADRRVRERYPVLASALLSAASGQLRNRATTGGNLLQRTRCTYFTDVTKPCNKRAPGSGCGALQGAHRNLAIIGATIDGPDGATTCIATHPSDMAVAMAALDALIQVEGPDGPRSIPILELHRLPGETPQLDTTLKPGELITAIDLPASTVAKNSRYLKIRDRAQYAFALVSVAGALELSGGNIKSARIALGGVAHKPWRASEAEADLVGKAPTEENFRHAAEIALKDAKGHEHNEFKIELAKRAIVRVLTTISSGEATSQECLAPDASAGDGDHAPAAGRPSHIASSSSRAQGDGS
jgi:xanthine dehydrogenase YagS FAD-binding subunit